MLFSFDQPADQVAGPITALAILYKVQGCTSEDHINLVLEGMPLQRSLFPILFSPKAKITRMLLCLLIRKHDAKLGRLLERSFDACLRLTSASRLRSLSFLNNVLIMSMPFLRDIEPYWSAIGNDDEVKIIKNVLLSASERGCLSDLYPLDYPPKSEMIECGICPSSPSMKKLAESFWDSATDSDIDSTDGTAYFECTGSP